MNQYRNEWAGSSADNAGRIAGTVGVIGGPAILEPGSCDVEWIVYGMGHGMQHQHARKTEHREGLGG